MKLQIIFQLPSTPCTLFNPAQQVCTVIAELLKHDPSLAVHPLLTDYGDLFYPQHNMFPMKKKEFENYFFEHPMPKCPICQNLIMIRY